MTKLPYTKIIDAADFDNPELRPFLEEVALGEMRRFGLSEPEIIPDSKQWECAMMLRTLSDEGVLRPGALLAGIGAGTEETTFVLASRGCVVFPTDRYLEKTSWSDVAPPSMMAWPEQFSQYEYPQGSVIPVHTDARSLSLPSNFFDGVFSAGSIEHFGSLEAVSAAAEEIARVLKPGGIAVLSTEFRLDGPNDKAWFHDDCILFTPKLLEEYIVEASGLEIIGKGNFETSSATYDSRVVLTDFLSKATKIKSIEDKRNAFPNLVLFHDGFLFCSVHLALRKPGPSLPKPGSRSSSFKKEVTVDSARTSARLLKQIVEPGSYELAAVAGGQDSLTALAARADAEARAARAEAELRGVMQSRSLRLTKPIRDLARVTRHSPTFGPIARFLIGLARRVTRGSR